jgi:hypothetical protein
VSDGRDEAPADLEMGGGFRGRAVKRRRLARSEVRSSGDVETEELSEREEGPEHPRPGRSYSDEKRSWRFSVRLKGPRDEG